MEYNINDYNMDAIRQFFIDYYEQAYFCGIGMAASDCAIIQNASDEELLEIAIQSDLIDINDYKIKRR